LTEEIWQILPRTKEEALIVSTWPEMKPFNANLISDFESTMEVISGIRTIRKTRIFFKDAIELKAINNENTATYFDSVVTKLGNLTSLEYVSEKSRQCIVLSC
jgi:valyl-tRNA synthetase